MFFKLRGIAANVIPGCFRTNKNMLFNLYAWIAIYAAKRYAVDTVLVDTA